MAEASNPDEPDEELAILAALRESQVASEAGRVISHEEAKRRSAAWVKRAPGSPNDPMKAP